MVFKDFSMPVAQRRGAMSVYKRTKTWTAAISLNGERVRCKGGFETEKAARRWHDKTKKLLKQGKGEQVYEKAATFQDLITHYNQTHLPTIRTNTQIRYRADIRRHIMPFFEFYNLKHIDQRVIETFKAKLLQEVSPKSTNNCLALLKSIFKKAYLWRLIKHDPCFGIGLVKVPQHKYTWWEHKEDIKRFVSFARNDRFHLAYRLGLDLGMRIGEITALTPGDIRTDIRQIHVHRQWLSRIGCYGPTKHGKERYLKYDAGSELEELILKQIEGRRNYQSLFTYFDGRIVNSQKLSSCFFQRVIKKAEVPRIRFHDLRHTFASWYMIKNDNIWELKKILGHADVQTTQRYAHLSSLHQPVPSFDW